MTNINELIELIGEIGGQASLDAVTKEYCKKYHMLLQPNYRNTIEATLKANAGVSIKFDTDTQLWKVNVEKNNKRDVTVQTGDKTNTAITDSFTTVEILEDIFRNCETLDKYLTMTDSAEYEFAIGIIKKGTCFLAVRKDGGYRFYPSRFIGYTNNSMYAHNENPHKDGRVTNKVISKILKKTKLVPDEELDLRYREFCKSLGFEAPLKGNFGVVRKFWMLDL